MDNTNPDEVFSVSDTYAFFIGSTEGLKSLFFAKDGSWGDATDLAVVDASVFTEDDLEMIAAVADSERYDYTLLLAQVRVEDLNNGGEA